MSDLLSLFTDAKTLFGKEKMKALEQAAHLAIFEFKTGQFERQNLQLYLDAIRTYLSTYRISDQSMSMTLTKIVKKMHELDGTGEAEIVITKQAEVSTESGTLQIADINLIPDPEYDPKKIINRMNHGELFMWGVGGDGTFGLIVRCIDSAMPVPTDKEYRIITGATSIGMLKVTSGEVVVTDMGFDAQQSKARIKVESGMYKVIVYSRAIPEKFHGYLVVLCKTDKEVSPELAEVPQLEV